MFYKFRPTLPLSCDTYCVQNTWEKIKSTENYENKWHPILTWIAVIYNAVLYSKHVGIVVTELMSIFARHSPNNKNTYIFTVQNNTIFHYYLCKNISFIFIILRAVNLLPCVLYTVCGQDGRNTSQNTLNFLHHKTSCCCDWRGISVYLVLYNTTTACHCNPTFFLHPHACYW